ncbi:UNVERIFIED_CONTAM: hypothetical protein FKN15_028530 [Acipenser sinensis]
MNSYGADVRLKTPLGLTALHVAAAWGRSQCIDELLKHGADIFKVRSVEFDFEKNNAAHHTRGVSSSSPILRRGQPFTITLHLNRTFQERNDTLDLIAETESKLVTALPSHPAMLSESRVQACVTALPSHPAMLSESTESKLVTALPSHPAMLSESTESKLVTALPSHPAMLSESTESKLVTALPSHPAMLSESTESKLVTALPSHPAMLSESTESKLVTALPSHPAMLSESTESKLVTALPSHPAMLSESTESKLVTALPSHPAMLSESTESKLVTALPSHPAMLSESTESKLVTALPSHPAMLSESTESKLVTALPSHPAMLSESTESKLVTALPSHPAMLSESTESKLVTALPSHPAMLSESTESKLVTALPSHPAMLWEVRRVEFDFEKNNAAHHTRGFEADIVHICLELLDVNPKHTKNPGLDCSRRSDPTYVGRVVSAMVNCVDDRGIINGRWDGMYYDGVSPSRWNGSVDILRRWFSCDCQPVRYGQCWVFAAVMCTVMRCLGIPTRPVTNYDSAHDTDGNLTIDEFYTLRYGMKVKESNDSMWNFHVWVESWMTRPDLPAGYDGWQVLDPTPQEKSEGVHCCGPAPVKAILEGDTDLKYDVAFVFAEVNADKVCWVVRPDGTMIRDSSDIKTIGKNISTKAVGSTEREDITHLYKYPEGSVKERAVFKKAIQRGSRILKNMLEHSDSYQITKGVQLNFVQETHAVSGKEIAVTLVIFNNSETAKSLTLNLNAQVMLYTGRPACQIWSRRVTTKIGPNTETEFPVSIAYSQYGRILRHNNTVKLTAIVVEDGGSREMSFTEKNIVVSGDPVQYQPMMAEVTFFNPLLEPLTDCTMSLTGSGLLFKTIDTCVGTLGPQLRVRLQIPFTPTKTGSRMLTVGFNSDQFCDIKAYTSVTINPPK